MRLLEIELENWKCHRNLAVDLTEGLEISGRNGAGKSSILEAVRYCFASQERGIKQKITNGERSLRVRLSFEFDRRKHVVEKTAHQDKPSAATLTVNGTQIADNPSSVGAELSKIMDEAIWDRLLYVPQGGLTAFVEELGGREGRKKFDALFGLDALESVWDAAGERAREEEARVAAVGEEMAKYPKNALEEYGNEKRALSNDAEKSRVILVKLERDLALALENVRGVEARIQELSAAKNRRKELSERLMSLEVSMAKKQKDIEISEKKLSELGATRREAEKLERRRRELEHYPQILEKMRLVDSLTERMKSGKSIDEFEKEVAAKRDSAVIEGELRMRFEAESRELKKLEDAMAKVGRDMELKAEYIENLQSLRGEAMCPRCGQRIYAGRVTTEIELARKDIQRLDAWQGGSQAELDRRKSLVTELERGLAMVAEIKAQLKVEEKALAERRREWEASVRELNSHETALRMLGYRGESREFVERNADEYSKANAAFEILLKDIADAERGRAGVDEMRRELEKLARERETTSAELERTAFSEDEHGRLLSEKNAKSEERYRMESEIRECKFRLKEIDAKTAENERKTAEYLEVKSRLEGAEKKLRLLKRAREVFHTDKGLPKYLRDKYVGQMGALLSRYFRQFNQNPAYKEVTFDRDYSIQVKSTNGVLSLTQLSGGERVQLAVALRIALIELLSPTRTLILDEPFGSLDRDHREILGETLNRMSGSWQLVVVTHVQVESINLPKLELSGY